MQNAPRVTYLKNMAWNFIKLEIYHGSMENNAPSEKLQVVGHFFLNEVIRNIYHFSMHDLSSIYIFKQYV